MSGTEILAPNYISNSGRTKGELKQAFEDILAIVKELTGGTGIAQKVIAGGAFASPTGNMLVEIESESGSADNLDNITGEVRDGKVLCLFHKSGHTITIRHSQGGSGQFRLKSGTSLALSADRQYAHFIYNETDTCWDELHRDLTFSLGKLPGGAAASGKTISSGAIVPDAWDTPTDTESASSSDDLDSATITNSIPLLMLRATNGSHAVVVKHATGNIYLGDNKDATLDDTDKRILLMLTGSNYYEVCRAGFNPEVLAKTTTFTATYGSTNKCDTSGGAYTATLPTAVGHQGKQITFIKTTSDTNALTLDGNSSETINGATTVTLSTQWESMRIVSDGSNWLEVAHCGAAVTGGSFFKASLITSSIRALPTSGALSGIYIHFGNWSSTGTITVAHGTRIYIKGNLTLNSGHTITVGNKGNGRVGSDQLAGHSGGGPGGGEGGIYQAGGGAGGSCGGSGGNGSHTTSTYNNGTTPPHGIFMAGGGGGGCGAGSGSATVGGDGGHGGGAFYIEVDGTVTISENITLNGTAGANSPASLRGAGAGGAGGECYLLCTGPLTVSSGKSITAAGGVGGDTNGGGYKGGGGGGGIVKTQSGGSTTMTGSISAPGGNKGGGSAGTVDAANGGTGITESRQNEMPISLC